MRVPKLNIVVESICGQLNRLKVSKISKENLSERISLEINKYRADLLTIDEVLEALERYKRILRLDEDTYLLDPLPTSVKIVGHR